MTAQQYRRLAKVKRVAERVLKDRNLAPELVRKAIRKAKGHRGDMTRAWDELNLMISFLDDQVKRRFGFGEYKKIPQRPEAPESLETLETMALWRAVLLAAAAVIYFVNPFDAVPDLIAGIGYIDDVALVLFVYKLISQELTEWYSKTEEEVFESETIDIEPLNSKDEFKPKLPKKGTA